MPTRESFADTANFTAAVTGAFFVRNAIALIGLGSLVFFAFFSA
jgi:hypothetical protein